jgi:D-3-phosphoglycerate dehydrogenase
VALADKLGAFAGQMVDVGLKGIDVAYEGHLAALNVKPLTAAALAGVLRPMLAEINMVSAPAVAKERGITVSESRQEISPVYDSLMRITVLTEMGRRAFAGTVVAGAPRIVEVKGMELDAAFASSMLYVNNLDKPGFIGALGLLLAETGTNIATFNLGRVGAGDDAIALVGVDQAPDDALIGKIRALPHVKEARALEF